MILGCFLISSARLADVHLNVEEIALTSTAQIRKLEIIMEELGKRLGTQDSSQIKWNVKRESCCRLGFANKQVNKCSLLATLSFQQDLVLLQGYHVSLHQLRRILVEIKFPDIIGFHFNHMSVLVAWLCREITYRLLNTLPKMFFLGLTQHNLAGQLSDSWLQLFHFLSLPSFAFCSGWIQIEDRETYQKRLICANAN